MLDLQSLPKQAQGPTGQRSWYVKKMQGASVKHAIAEGGKLKNICWSHAFGTYPDRQQVDAEFNSLNASPARGVRD